MTTTLTPPTFALSAALLSEGFALRPETDDDEAFLRRLYASGREAELAQVDWSAEQKAGFLNMQFDAQRRHYRTQIPGCAFNVIEHRGEPVGRLYLEERATRLHIVDIILIGDQRGRGLGTRILQGLTASAASRGKGVGIFVEKFNPALNLYRRLGFTEVADAGVYLEMEWTGAPG